MFPDMTIVREMQSDLDELILQGVRSITQLKLTNDDTTTKELSKVTTDNSIIGA